MLNGTRMYFKQFLVKLNDLSLPSHISNFKYNQKVWDRYAKFWNKSWMPFEKANSEKERTASQHLGDEWGNAESVNTIIQEYILPYITTNNVVGELGSGGARIASKVVSSTKQFYCFDISSGMLKRAEAALSDHSNVSYVLLAEPKFSNEFTERFDFIYSFDVFVHLDLHTMWKYFQELHKILKKGGRCFIHTSNLKSPGGWDRFISQNNYSVQGHYFISPEIIRILAEQSQLSIVKESTYDPSNFYLNRDYLAILQKI